MFAVLNKTSILQTQTNTKIMTQEEYNVAKKSIQKEAEEKLNRLMRDYCKDNNLYKVGDIVEDHSHIIKITRICGVYMDTHGYPAYKFTGIELKKDLTPKKIQDTPFMYQGNVKRKLN